MCLVYAFVYGCLGGIVVVNSGDENGQGNIGTTKLTEQYFCNDLFAEFQTV